VDPAPPGAEHGAFAFCDLAGFTAFTEERGDDAAVALVEAFRREVAASLPPSGRIANRVGDGLLLHIGDPAEAVGALLTLTDRCSAGSTPETPLWVRTGLHQGQARRLGDDLIGHDVNVAARIGSLAAASEVLVSEQARDAHEGQGVRFDALGPVFVKGVTDPLRLFRATWVAAPIAAG
jgi:adenylate cyclase